MNRATDNIARRKLAVLMACYNRRDTTLASLQALYQQKITFDVYLVDDGSSDGTSNAVKVSYPNVKILQGDGNLFWVGGMRLAFAEALKKDYDYYLWLNDDTLLEPDALPNLLGTHQSLAINGYPNSIIVGSVRDPVTGKLTYGGRVYSNKRLWHKFEALEPSQEPQKCDTMHGNIVLIPRSVAEIVGNLDNNFIHTMGDLDYGLRAGQLGCSVWIAPGYVGSCSQNSVQGSWADTNLPLFDRLKKAFQPKGFPLKAWFVYSKRHNGPFWFIQWTFPYIRAVIGYKNLSASSTFCEDSQPKSS
jgi:GT2 family glycosyltransferase